MNFELKETKDQTQARFVSFEGSKAEQLKLTENKIYQLHNEVDNETEAGASGCYVINDIGIPSFSSFIVLKHKFYK